MANREQTAAKEFQRFLEKKKISPSQIQERFGIPRMTIWRWLNRKAKPSPLAKAVIKANLGFKWPE